MRLRSKLRLVIFGVVLVTVLYGILLFSWSRRAEREMRHSELSNQQLEALLQLSVDSIRYVKEATAFLAHTRTDSDVLRVSVKQMEASADHLVKLFGEEPTLGEGEGEGEGEEKEKDLANEQARNATIQSLVRTLVLMNDEIISAPIGNSAERERLASDFKFVFDYGLMPLLSRAAESEQQEVKESAEDLLVATRQARIAAAFVPIALAISLFGLALLVGRPAGRILGFLLDGTRKVAAGDLTWRIPVYGNDELSTLGAAFNRMVSDLRDTTVSKQFVDDIIRSMGDALFVIDADGSIRVANEAACALLGQPNAALLGRPASEVLHSPDGSPFVLLPSTAAERIELDLEVRTANGSRVPLRATCSALGKPGGETSFVVVGRDLRETIRLAEAEAVERETRRYNERLEETVRSRTAELEGSRNELAERLRQLSEAHARLRAADRLAAIGTLVAGVAHEINNPLTYLASNLRFVSSELEMARTSGRRGISDTIEEVRSALLEAQEGVMRIASIVNDLRAFSRVDEQSVMPTSVQGALETALTMARAELKHRARLICDFEPVPLVLCNEARLIQVFLNVIINGAQAMEPGHAERNTLKVSTRCGEGDQVVVEITDTGEGIPEEIRDRIFDPFFTTKPVGKGTGLGLSICHGIVKSLGGEITVQSEVGRGTTFRITMPSTKETEIPAESEFRAAAGVGGCLLVVDDEPFIGTSIRRLLGRDHVVVAIQNAREALEMIESGESFDVVLCDVMMPEMSGIAFFQRLSQIAPKLAERLVFITGGEMPFEAKQFLEEHPDRFISKPFDPDKLHQVVDEYLKRREHA